jgi:hypothetical protein
MLVIGVESTWSFNRQRGAGSVLIHMLANINALDARASNCDRKRDGQERLGSPIPLGAASGPPVLDWRERLSAPAAGAGGGSERRGTESSRIQFPPPTGLQTFGASRAPAVTRTRHLAVPTVRLPRARPTG